MNYIFLDLEFNQPYRCYRNSRLPFEIMEIGSVKTDSNLNVIDTFKVYIKNTIYHKINPYVTKTTGITKETLKSGLTFKKAFNLFLEWIGDDYKILTYSNNDILVFKQNCSYYNVKNLNYNNYVDVQKEVMKFFNLGNQLSLKNAAIVYDIDLNEYKEHDALHDSLITYKVYKEYINNKDKKHEIQEKYDYILDKFRKSFDQVDKNEILNIDKRKYKISCPECKKPLSTLSTYYNSSTKYVMLKKYCKKCNSEYYQSVKFKRNIHTKELIIAKSSIINSKAFSKEEFKNHLEEI